MPVSGLYSGIFTFYLQYHESQRDANTKGKKIVFYALSMLYVLSATIIILGDTIYAYALRTVSRNDHPCLLLC